jgi:hypothetical protein
MVAFVPAAVELTDAGTKWGLLTVTRDDGSIERQDILDAELTDAICRGECLPPGVTVEQHGRGQAIVVKRPCRPGQGLVQANGWLVVNAGVRRVGKLVQADVVRVPPTHWAAGASAPPGTLLLEAALARELGLEVR